MKELAIRDYISKVNWKANWNYKVIEEDMDYSSTIVIAEKEGEQ